MSDAKEVSHLDQMKQQLDSFVTQRDQVQINLQQLLGAIFACEMMIKKYEEDLKALSQENLGDSSNGQADKQKQEQAA